MTTLDMAMAAADAAQAKPFAIDAARCIRVRNRNVPCNRCAKACPANAVRIQGQSIAVDWRACSGCLACTLACPTQALSNVGPTDAQATVSALVAFEAAATAAGAPSASTPSAAAASSADAASAKPVAATPDVAAISPGSTATSPGAADSPSAATPTPAATAYLACEQARETFAQMLNESLVGKISCLAQIDESLLISLAAAGARRVLAIVGICDSCPRFASCGGAQAAESLARKSASQANEVLAAFDMQLQLGVAPKLPRFCAIASERGYDAGRRGIFGQLKDTTTSAFGAAMAQQLGSTASSNAAPSIYEQLRVNAAGTLPTFTPSRRTALMQAIGELGMPRDVMWNVRLWGYPVVDETRCVGCNMCATFCPSGALSIESGIGDEGDCSLPSEGDVGGEGDCPLPSAGEPEPAPTTEPTTAPAPATEPEPEGPVNLLVFRTDLCLKCKTCAVVCITHAIDFSDAVFAQDVATNRVDVLKVIEPAD